MTRPLAANSASWPSGATASPEAGAARGTVAPSRTLAVTPRASAIWEATVRCQISS